MEKRYNLVKRSLFLPSYLANILRLRETKKSGIVHDAAFFGWFFSGAGCRVFEDCRS